MLKIQVSTNLRCEVDQNKDDCKREPAHCHVTKNGTRVAQVMLNPVQVKSGSDLSRNEEAKVIQVVSENREKLEEEYRNNANKPY